MCTDPEFPLLANLVKRDSGIIWECRFDLRPICGSPDRYCLTIHSGVVEKGLTRAVRSGTLPEMQVTARRLAVKKYRMGFRPFMCSREWADLADAGKLRVMEASAKQHAQPEKAETLTPAELEAMIVSREWVMQDSPRGLHCRVIRIGDDVTQSLDANGGPVELPGGAAAELASMLPKGMFEAVVDGEQVKVLDVTWAEDPSGGEQSFPSRMVRLAALLRGARKVSPAFVYTLSEGKREAIRVLRLHGGSNAIFRNAAVGGRNRNVRLS